MASGLIRSYLLSVDRVGEFVDLSLLPEDTGRSDVLPESLNLPLRLSENQKKKKQKRRAPPASEQVTERLRDNDFLLGLFKNAQQHKNQKKGCNLL